MASTIVRVNPIDPEPAIIASAAERLARGELVAFPTETVYGLGADALNPDAVARIYAAKGRPAWNPLIAHVADIDGARALTSVWPPIAEKLAQHFWPGPLTLVLPKRADVPDITTAGLDAVAVRVPSHPVALALLRAVQRPIAAPSANRFTQVSPTTAQHVVSSLGDRVPFVLDGGPSEVGIESTVVDLSGDVPRLLRPGMITRAQLEAVAGAPVLASEGRVRANDAAAAPQRSPGMADRHYAPRADVWLFDATQLSELRDALGAWVAANGNNPGARPIVALLRHAALPLAPDDMEVRMPDDPAAYARALYSALHEADDRDAALVLIEFPPDSDVWSGVRDRLARAARSAH